MPSRQRTGPSASRLRKSDSGKQCDGQERSVRTRKLDGSYWRRHARQPVQFRTGIGTMAELGVDLVIEAGPHAVLGPLVSLVWSDVAGGAREPTVLESMLRPSDDPDLPDRDEAFLEAVAGAYEAGQSISFAGLFSGEARRRIELPGYPFQRQRHCGRDPETPAPGAAAHPLLGARHESPRGEVMFETEMFPSDPCLAERPPGVRSSRHARRPVRSHGGCGIAGRGRQGGTGGGSTNAQSDGLCGRRGGERGRAARAGSAWRFRKRQRATN